MIAALRWAFSHPRAWAIAAAGLSAYAALYLLAARAIVIDPGAGLSRFGPLPQLVVAEITARTLLSWLDPLFVLYASDAVVFAPSALGLVTALGLGSLVGANFALAVEAALRPPPGCARVGGWWTAAALPSFLASFSCCAPTVLLLLGANFAATVITVVPFVVPLAALLLAASLAWGLRRIERTALALA